MALQTAGGSVGIINHPGPTTTCAVVCSLEPWGEVRRRIRILVDELVDLRPGLSILYVDPPLDVPHELRRRRVPDLGAPRLEAVRPRIHRLRPRKWWPRVLGPRADRALSDQLLRAAGALGMHRPLLWINDATYAGLAVRTGWPCLYDITDDWLAGSLTSREHARLAANEDLLLARADAVVVCSPDLERSRGRHRPVDLVPNGVDAARFGVSYPRPADLPPAPVALYVGSLHDTRLDVPLVLELAARRSDIQVVLVGPDSLGAPARRALGAAGNVHLLGSRPYEQIAAYLLHADVVIVPHLVNPFTESLDPIKAYEYLAAGRPTVATPVAGFRELGPPVVVAGRDRFVEATGMALATAPPAGTPSRAAGGVPTWRARAEAMATVMDRARAVAARR